MKFDPNKACGESISGPKEVALPLMEEDAKSRIPERYWHKVVIDVRPSYTNPFSLEDNVTWRYKP